jgi:hypothetical protein
VCAGTFEDQAGWLGLLFSPQRGLRLRPGGWLGLLEISLNGVCTLEDQVVVGHREISPQRVYALRTGRLARSTGK